MSSFHSLPIPQSSPPISSAGPLNALHVQMHAPTTATAGTTLTYTVTVSNPTSADIALGPCLAGRPSSTTRSDLTGSPKSQGLSIVRRHHPCPARLDHRAHQRPDRSWHRQVRMVAHRRAGRHWRGADRRPRPSSVDTHRLRLEESARSRPGVGSLMQPTSAGPPRPLEEIDVDKFPRRP